MAYDDIPNGFINQPRKKPGFESAGDAIRKSRREALSGRSSVSESLTRDFEREAFRNGWQASAARSQQSASTLSAGFYAQPQSKRRHKNDVFDYVKMPDSISGKDSFEFNYDKLHKIADTEERWSWVEIDRNAIHNNIMAIRRTLDPQTMFMAVVKADGYGHGGVACAKTAINAGAEYIGVATIEEAIALRDAGIDSPILILSEPPIAAIPLLLAYQVMPSVTTVEFAVRYAEEADSIGMEAPYHLKVNTGMNRIGVRYDHVLDFLSQISFHRALDLVGTFTHFATADAPDNMDFNLQRQRFEDVIRMMRGAGIEPGIVHAANSAATLRYPQVQYDMVRVGLAMYGCFPCEQTFGSVNLLPAMSVHARITQVNKVPVGEGVSYGLVHRSNGFGKTCTIPVGYADGLRRGLSNRIGFIKDGRVYPQVGNICMDQCMFEVDDRSRYGKAKSDPKIGDKVTIVGSDGDAFVTIDEMAAILNTIPYELMIGFGSSRLPRVYI